MENKKVNLANQYLFKAVIMLMVLIVFITSILSNIPNEIQKGITAVSYIIMLLCGISGFWKQEKVDESAEKALGKIHGIIYVFSIVVLTIIACIIGSPFFQNYMITRQHITIIILIFLSVITFLKTILFVYYNRKGI